MGEFIAVFLPLFVAIDAIGMLPVYISLTEPLHPLDRKRILLQALLAGFLTSLIFLFAGKAIFHFLGITADDFRLGGGLLLLVISMNDVTQSQKDSRRISPLESGIVPLGIPLIIGPAALTTVMILADRSGYILTIISLLINLFLTWLTFSKGEIIVKVFGKSGTRAMGKVISILLMAIAVMMIRVSLGNMFPQMFK